MDPAKDELATAAQLGLEGGAGGVSSISGRIGAPPPRCSDETPGEIAV